MDYSIFIQQDAVTIYVTIRNNNTSEIVSTGKCIVDKAALTNLINYMVSEHF